MRLWFFSFGMAKRGAEAGLCSGRQSACDYRIGLGPGAAAPRAGRNRRASCSGSAADIERGFDDGVAGEARRDRLEIRDFPGRGAAGHCSSSSGQGAQDAQPYMGGNGPAGMPIASGRERRRPLSEKRKPRRGEAGVFGRTSTGENLIVRKISNSIFE